MFKTHAVANNGRDSGTVSTKALGDLEVRGIQILEGHYIAECTFIHGMRVPVNRETGN